MTRRLGLRARLVLTYLLLVVLGVGTLVLRLGGQLQYNLEEEAEHELEVEAFLIASALRESANDLVKGKLASQDLTPILIGYVANAEGRVTVIGRDYQVIASSEPDIVPLHREHEHPEITSALAGLEQHDIRWDEWTNARRLFVAVPLRHDEDLVGAVQVSIPYAYVEAKIQAAWLNVASSGLAVALLAVPLSLWLAGTILGPVRQLKAAAVRVAQGQFQPRLTVNGHDELAELSQAFNEMAEQIEILLERQRQFIADASHELRTPITGIKLRSEALLAGGRDDPEIAERFLREVDAEADRLTRLSNELLDLARLNGRRSAALHTPLDLAALVRQVIQRFEVRAVQAGIHLETALPETIPMVLGHADQLDQALSNLLDNALKYTPTGGKVIVQVTTADLEHGRTGETRRSADKEKTKARAVSLSSPLPVASSSPTAYLLIQVTDTGQGIPPEDLPYIFERFYRVDKARSRRQGGAGLGLSIVKAIVEAHGGQVGAESTLGQGTRVWFTLPVLQVTQSLGHSE